MHSQLETDRDWQAGQSGIHILRLPSHALVIRAECGLALSCSKIKGCPWNRWRLDGSTCCSKILTYLLAAKVQVISSMCTDISPCHLRPDSNNSLGYPCRLWSREHGRPFFLSDPLQMLTQSTEHASAMLLGWHRAQKSQLLDGVGIWLQLCIVKLLLASVDTAVNGFDGQRLTKVLPRPCYAIHYSHMTVLKMATSEGLRITRIQKTFSSFKHRDSTRSFPSFIHALYRVDCHKSDWFVFGKCSQSDGL